MDSLIQVIQKARNILFSKDNWQTLGDYLGFNKSLSKQPITSQETLAFFLKSRASHVAQSSLYGYLKTRAGTRFPEMFKDPGMLLSMNIAKWQIWLACLSDISVYVGGLIKKETNCDNEVIHNLLGDALQHILDETGIPEESDKEFPVSAEAVRRRIMNIDFASVTDDDFAFTESPESLFRWSPIADELKKFDKTIVQNSIRFRWIEIRRNARKLLKADELLSSVQT